MTRNRKVWGAAALAACTLASAGCEATEATKAGGSAEPVTLRLGTNDDEGAPTTAMIDAFAERVRELSDGAVLIEPVYAPVPPGPNWDQRVAGLVTDGELEMALIPARAWDTEGVDTLRPFSLPFLMTSEDLVDDVVRSDVGERMLAGLGTAGMTGLALIPESLRYTFSFGEPLTSPAAFAGTTIRVPRSDTLWNTFRSWGATPDDPSGPEAEDAIRSGTIAGAESGLARTASLPAPTTVAGNLATSANVQTLVISTEVLDGLPDAQVDLLRQASTEARDDVMADATGASADAQDYCARGGRIVTAPDADVAALQAAAQPVVDRATEDPDTAALVASVRELADDRPPTVMSPCGTTPPPASAVSVPDTAGAFPEGVYRTESSAEELVAAGMTELEASNHAGIWTLTFDGGEVVVQDVRTRDGQASTGTGSYCVANGRVTVTAEQTDGCDESSLFVAAWTSDGRELRFTDVEVGSLGGGQPFAVALWGSPTWTRID
jgi:TRAP-type C4-dicarboxylate transport system substrate-binding protein